MRSLLARLRALHPENIDQKGNGNLSKVGLFAILTANSVTTGARELNGTGVISLATHYSKREMREI